MNDYIFSYESPLTHYTADAFVLRCIDDRFRKAFDAFLEAEKIIWRDVEQVAGGAKILASPPQESEREFMLGQIALSRQLHHTKKIMLATHHDCGAYGGFSAFGTAEAEFAAHISEHEKARVFIMQRFPDWGVENYFIDERGVRRIF